MAMIRRPGDAELRLFPVYVFRRGWLLAPLRDQPDQPWGVQGKALPARLYYLAVSTKHPELEKPVGVQGGNCVQQVLPVGWLLVGGRDPKGALLNSVLAEGMASCSPALQSSTRRATRTKQ